MLIVPKTAQRLWLTMILDYVRGATGGANPLFILHLFQNDFAPNSNTVLADFTEASFPGYAAKMIGGDFPFPVTNADGFAQSTSPLYTFTPSNNTDNQEIHGWYLTFQTDVVPALLFACERCQPSVRMSLPGVDYRLQIQLVLGSKFT